MGALNCGHASPGAKKRFRTGRDGALHTIVGDRPQITYSTATATNAPKSPVAILRASNR